MRNSFTKMITERLVLMISILFSASLALAQGQVSGVVTDNADGSPLPGVSVILKGSTTGTITDVDGAFSLNANTTDVLVFSYVGYTTQEFTVGAQTNFAVGLAVDIQQLEEIVVTGYTSQSKRTVTGAMSQVNVSEAFAVPTSNASEALQGRVSG
ncbi:MAG: carboxypeptidase-like regulatory domain-containing protein, partial [Bacteroidetes bacterium]|nr:carboxypeptidase-like regulatory domain-containing protein [Bacteroidota bacterium]